MARRNDHSKEELQALILSSALELVRKNGIEGLSARKLASKIKYSPGTVYSFYKNIDDLVMHINAYSLDSINLEIKKLTTVNHKNILRSICKIIFNFNENEKNLWQLLFEYKYSKKTKIPMWYQEKITLILDKIEKTLLKISKNKIIAHKLSRVFWTGLFGVISHNNNYKIKMSKSLQKTELMDSFLDHFLKGLI